MIFTLNHIRDFGEFKLRTTKILKKRANIGKRFEARQDNYAKR